MSSHRSSEVLRACQLALRSSRNKPEFFQAGAKPDKHELKRRQESLFTKKGLKRKRGRQSKPPEGSESNLLSSSPSSSCTSSSAGSKTTGKRWKAELMVIEEGDDVPEEHEPLLGHVVWALFGGFHSYHPALVIKGNMVNLATADGTQAFVFWFSDSKVSAVPRGKLLDFVPYFKEKSVLNHGKQGQRGVLKAIKELQRRAATLNPGLMDMDLLHWARSGFPTENSTGHKVFKPGPDFQFPESILERLSAIGREIQQKASQKDRDIPNKFHEEHTLTAVWQGTKSITDICIGCADCDRKVICQHPLFRGGLCCKCKELLQETFYAVGEDGTHSFCAICGAGGQLFVCDTTNCGRVYCVPCVEELGGEDVLRKVGEVREAKRWPCFLCQSHKPSSHGLLKPLPDWQKNLILFFDMGHRTTVVPDLDYFKIRRPIRVLSLFDGIGTGLLALQRAGFVVEVYYASETDEQAAIISQANHGQLITQLGDVVTITKDKLAELVPIDLLMGGSPCNEFSLANPLRKGFDMEGSGVLFFDFYRILRDLLDLNGNTHLFWMFENVASMPTAYRSVISRFLQCQPAVWDAKHVSAQKRSRFFWGNIPGLYSTPEVSEALRQETDLNSVLTQQCHRQATVHHVRTITTNPNSLLQGPGRCSLPVSMAGGHDTLWLSELERLFGFPAHYTDVCNLPPSKRRALLGRSWSVQVITEILRPLMHYFATVDTEDSTASTAASNESHITDSAFAAAGERVSVTTISSLSQNSTTAWGLSKIATPVDSFDKDRKDGSNAIGSFSSKNERCDYAGLFVVGCQDSHTSISDKKDRGVSAADSNDTDVVSAANRKDTNESVAMANKDSDRSVTTSSSDTDTSIANKDIGTSATIAKKDSGTSATIASKDTHTSATIANKDYGTSATIANKDTGTSATIANKDTGISDTIANKDTGTCDAIASKDTGTSATIASKDTGTFDAIASKDSGTFATIANKDTGTFATVASKDTGICATIANKDTGTSDAIANKDTGTSDTIASKDTGTSDVTAIKDTGRSANNRDTDTSLKSFCKDKATLAAFSSKDTKEAHKATLTAFSSKDTKEAHKATLAAFSSKDTKEAHKATLAAFSSKDTKEAHKATLAAFSSKDTKEAHKATLAAFSSKDTKEAHKATLAAFSSKDTKEAYKATLAAFSSKDTKEAEYNYVGASDTVVIGINTAVLSVNRKDSDVPTAGNDHVISTGIDNSDSASTRTFENGISFRTDFDFEGTAFQSGESNVQLGDSRCVENHMNCYSDSIIIYDIDDINQISCSNNSIVIFEDACDPIIYESGIIVETSTEQKTTFSADCGALVDHDYLSTNNSHEQEAACLSVDVSQCLADEQLSQEEYLKRMSCYETLHEVADLFPQTCSSNCERSVGKSGSVTVHAEGKCDHHTPVTETPKIEKHLCPQYKAVDTPGSQHSELTCTDKSLFCDEGPEEDQLATSALTEEQNGDRNEVMDTNCTTHRRDGCQNVIQTRTSAFGLARNSEQLTGPAEDSASDSVSIPSELKKATLIQVSAVSSQQAFLLKNDTSDSHCDHVRLRSGYFAAQDHGDELSLSVPCNLYADEDRSSACKNESSLCQAHNPEEGSISFPLNEKSSSTNNQEKSERKSENCLVDTAMLPPDQPEDNQDEIEILEPHKPLPPEQRVAPAECGNAITDVSSDKNSCDPERVTSDLFSRQINPERSLKSQQIQTKSETETNRCQPLSFLQDCPYAEGEMKAVRSDLNCRSTVVKQESSVVVEKCMTRSASRVKSAEENPVVHGLCSGRIIKRRVSAQERWSKSLAEVRASNKVYRPKMTDTLNLRQQLTAADTVSRTNILVPTAEPRMTTEANTGEKGMTDFAGRQVGRAGSSIADDCKHTTSSDTDKINDGSCVDTLVITSEDLATINSLSINVETSGQTQKAAESPTSQGHTRFPAWSKRLRPRSVCNDEEKKTCRSKVLIQTESSWISHVKCSSLPKGSNKEKALRNKTTGLHEHEVWSKRARSSWHSADIRRKASMDTLRSLQDQADSSSAEVSGSTSEHHHEQQHKTVSLSYKRNLPKMSRTSEGHLCEQNSQRMVTRGQNYDRSKGDGKKIPAKSEVLKNSERVNVCRNCTSVGMLAQAKLRCFLCHSDLESSCMEAKTNTLQRKSSCREGSTNTLQRKSSCREGSTDTLQRKSSCREGSTNTLQRKSSCREGSTDTLQIKSSCREGSTNTLQRKSSCREGSTDTLQRKSSCREGSTHTLQRKSSCREGSTNTLQRKSSCREGSTNTLQRKLSCREGSTNTLQRKSSCREGSTDTLQRKSFCREGSTNTLQGQPRRHSARCSSTKVDKPSVCFKLVSSLSRMHISETSKLPKKDGLTKTKKNQKKHKMSGLKGLILKRGLETVSTDCSSAEYHLQKKRKIQA